jgi:pilus assembly protein Flp/PilA
MLKIQMFIHKLVRPVQNVEGASAIEYGLLAALISVAIIGTATLVGDNLSNVFGNIATELGAALN